eukprot:scaffold36077_cov44-Phaeocystis_antarctica.AAC.1
MTDETRDRASSPEITSTSLDSPVCNRVHSGADETTTLAHLCATRGSWRWTRVAAGTHWSPWIHLTHDCHSRSAATAHGVASGHAVVRSAGRNLASRARTASTTGVEKRTSLEGGLAHQYSIALK